MRIKKQPLQPLPRKIEFDGVHRNDSLLIGNFGDVEFVAKGSFELSGLIYCVRNAVTFFVKGDGHLTFHGTCRKLVVEYASGNCVLDFSKLETKEVCCVALKGNAEVIIGPTKVVSRANVHDEAVLRYTNNPVFTNHTVSGMARIEPVERMAVAKAG
ncbi:hypothetical protein [Chryseolinea lacunae]|uniref:Auto-transporter adhesin head GIN domain-containing protein n=1 Tax=Chryseolinea lacunae TaxID=2801331 RepID=A0ABS1KYD2_9BACT|nr:hypothetical protein [Chryseolinea lacunae]MBL0744460.1 hypothetical protein [Chryseolinea lacunae]